MSKGTSKKGKSLIKASVVICSWNGGEDLMKALGSIEIQSYDNIETIVSDNGSSDDSIKRAKERFKNVKYILNDKNLGFAEGNNVGIAASSGEIVFTINQDVILNKYYIENIVRFFDKSEEKIGSVTGKVLRINGKVIDSVGLKLTKTRRFFDIGAGEPDGDRFDKSQEVFGVCAAAAAYRRTMLESIKQGENEYFDNRFFLLVEDVDLAWRAQHAGYKAWYLSNVRCLHIRGGAGWKSKFKQYLSFRNRYFLIIKNDHFRNILLSLPYLIVYDVSRFFYILFTNKLALKAIAETLVNLKAMFKHRRRIFKSSKLTAREAYRWLK